MPIHLKQTLITLNMEAKDLRITNYVLVNNVKYHPELQGIPVKVIGLEEKDNKLFPDSNHVIRVRNEYNSYAQFNEYIEPIPLTQEWLIRFGAKYNSKFIIHDRFKLMYKEAYNYWYVSDLNSLTYLSKVEFVHEWQNFFYAMNDHELTLQDADKNTPIKDTP